MKMTQAPVRPLWPGRALSWPVAPYVHPVRATRQAAPLTWISLRSMELSDSGRTQSLFRRNVGSIQERLGLPDRQPIPDSHALRLGALHARDASGQLRRQKTVVSCLDRQLPDGSDTDVDGDGAQSAGLERHSPGVHGCLREAGPGLLAVPRDELVQAEIVDPARDRR